MRLIAAAGLLATLRACAAIDPLLSQQDWQPTGAKEAKIAAEVVNPTDLVQGREPMSDVNGQIAPLTSCDRASVT